MGYAKCVATELAKIKGKKILNGYVRGSSSLLDFADAVYCFYKGDVCGGARCVVSGVADLYEHCGLEGLVNALTSVNNEDLRRAQQNCGFYLPMTVKF